jgi:predicted nucleic acid-binding protein
MILLDTSVLSLAYRRKYPTPEDKPKEVLILQKMVETHKPIAIPGIVFQEFLSGLRENSQFQQLQRMVEGFPIILATQPNHLKAANIANICRHAGVITSATDCLISAITIERQAQLFTTDQDFVHIASHCPLRLFYSTG